MISPTEKREAEKSAATAQGSLTMLRYVLITPARNEEKHIETLIQSMIAQTVLPVRWVIVNDGSSDATAKIVESYLQKHDWIELLTLPTHRDRSFAAKVHAFNAGPGTSKGSRV